jgi:hypothetical protein
MFAEFWKNYFAAHHLPALNKRWVTPQDIYQWIQTLSDMCKVNTIGMSAENRPIYSISLGNGQKNILAWACMHGNETTSLRGMADLLTHIHKPDLHVWFAPLLKEYTIHFIPMLNPDGAQRYIRRNAHQLDINRDALAQQTPEMRALKQVISDLKPVLAMNMHDQRSIFHVGNKPATISFLAPSVDEERTLTEDRKTTMRIISSIHPSIAPILSGGIGRYSDEFYPTAIGEYVQKKGIPTILVECGASVNDPLRQEARMAQAVILHSAMQNLQMQQNSGSIEAYHEIPLNENNQLDIIIKDVQLTNSSKADVGLLSEHSIKAGVFHTVYRIVELGDLSFKCGLKTFTAIKNDFAFTIDFNQLANFTLQTTEGRISFKEGVWQELF